MGRDGVDDDATLRGRLGVRLHAGEGTAIASQHYRAVGDRVPAVVGVLADVEVRKSIRHH
jgi:hypothetical protein